MGFVGIALSSIGLYVLDHTEETETESLHR